MEFSFYRFLIVVGVLAFQFFLSTRNNIYWGAILPVAYTVFLTWMYIAKDLGSILSYVLILLVGLLFLMMEWNGGRKYLHEKRKKELDKMKLLDIR